MWLGENGLYPDHPLKGRVVAKRRSSKLYTVTDVYVHYYDGGYYYMALLDDERKSTASMSWNINCPKPKIVCNSNMWDIDLKKI